MISQRTYWAAMSELKTLKYYCAWSGEDLRSLIEVPEWVKANWRRYLVEHPEEHKRFAFVLAYRQAMLDRLDQELHSQGPQ